MNAVTRTSVMMGLALVLMAGVAQADFTTAYNAGAERLLAQQNADGGWNWPLRDEGAAEASAANTVSQGGMGLVAAYRQTGDVRYLNGAIAAADKVLDIGAAYTSAGFFLAAVSDLTGDPQYRDAFDDVYDDNPNRPQEIWSLRTNQGFPNVAAWDVSKLGISAFELGVSWAEEAAGVADILDGGTWLVPTADCLDYDVANLAGAVFLAGVTGYEFNGITLDMSDSTTRTIDSTEDLANVLLEYQAANGAFYGNAASTVEYAAQETAYAILALSALDREGYADEIDAASAWLLDTQLGTGGWASNFGENSVVTGEVLWALNEAYPVPEPATLSLLGLGLAGLVGRRMRRRG